MGYLYLAAAIVGELFGTTFLKYTDGFTKLWPSIGSIVSYGICFYMFSKALRTVNLSVAYATWSALGIIAATMISVILFKEGITLAGVIGIVLMIIGVILLNCFGTAAH